MNLESSLVLLAGILAIVAVFLLLAPGPIYVNGILDLMPAFSLLLDWAPRAAIAAVLTGIAALAFAARRKSWFSLTVAVSAVITGAGVWLSVNDFKSRAGANPLHDITTNLDTPPVFQRIEPRSYEQDGPDAAAAYPHPDWRSRHAEIYPDIAPLIVQGTLSDISLRARRIANDIGWTIVAEWTDDEVAYLEASDVTPWFGFTDDIVVELRTQPEGNIQIDVRSVSRIGIGDVVKNAARVREFLSRMEG